MADDARIEALRKRLQKDPGSIAFAQLAEEYRRAGRFHESIEVCRAGLARHPGYLSARVTLGRALLEIGDIDSAQRELNDVLRVAPDNLGAIRGIAEVHRKKGEIPEALEQFRSAFEMASPDPSIEQAVRTSGATRWRRPVPRPAERSTPGGDRSPCGRPAWATGRRSEPRGAGAAHGVPGALAAGHPRRPAGPPVRRPGLTSALV